MKDPNCIFCKIASDEIPANFAYRSEDVVAIFDLNPQAPRHVLVMPVEHTPNLDAFTESESADLIAKVMRVAAELGSEDSDGFRAVINTGPSGGQTVDHLHVHVLSGRQMHWPPG